MSTSLWEALCKCVARFSSIAHYEGRIVRTWERWENLRGMLNDPSVQTRVSAFTSDALGTLDAVGIAAAVANGDISVNEATQAAIQRAERVNPTLNAIALRFYEDALSGKHLEKDGLLYGVPTFIKDNEYIAGYPTQQGNGAFIAKPAKRHSKYVRQFLSTGVNPLGKTTLPEFAFICSTENERWGITRNPWHTDYTTGGSSSGSAALVAAGAVPIAVANDGAGSTRLPASCCGLVGLKPSRGRLHAIHGTESLPVQITYNGVVTRTVRDTAAFYAAAERHYHYPKIPRLGHVLVPLKNRLRIAFFENLPAGRQGHMDEDTWRVQLETARLLESLGHTVEQVPIPLDVDAMTRDYLNYYGFLAFMTVRFGRFVHGAPVDASMLDTFTTGLMKTFTKNYIRLPGGLVTLKRSVQKVEQALGERYDLIMSCVTTKTTPKLGYFSPTLPFEEISQRAADFATFLPMFNFSGAPAISLPLGTAENGLPIGVQLAAAYGQDGLLLELALELEAARPWKTLADS
jgi:amidase